MKNNSLRPHVNFTVIKRSYLRVVVSTGSPASLDFEFIRECMEINKIRPKFHFLTQNIEKQMTHLVFLFSVFTVSFLLEPFGSRLIEFSVLKIVNFYFLSKNGI